MPSPDLSVRIRAACRSPIFDAAALTPVDHGRDAIGHLLPHRGPMLLLDRLTGVDPAAGRIAAVRRLEAHDPGFDGHFPGDPVYPGALQIEAAGQCGLCLRHFVAQRSTSVPQDARPAPVRLVRVLEARFVEAVRPGDVMTLLAEVLEDDGYTFSTLGQILVGGRPAGACAFEAMILGDET